MEYRKLIKFGTNSIVISLPKRWIERYQLKKGDVVNIETVGTNLFISPKDNNLEDEERLMDITIDKKDTFRTIKRKILSAYEHNATTINIIGEGTKEHSPNIISLIDSLVGLEIVEHTSRRIVAKVYVKSKDISIESFLKRIDNGIKSMLIDINDCYTEKIENDADFIDDIKRREQNIDKLSRLLARVVKERLYKQSINSNNPLVLLRYSHIVENLETLADYVEEIATIMSSKPEEVAKNTCLTSIPHVKECFEQVTKAIYTESASLAYPTSDQIHELKLSVNKYINENSDNLLTHKIIESVNILRELNKLTY